MDFIERIPPPTRGGLKFAGPTLIISLLVLLPGAPPPTGAGVGGVTGAAAAVGCALLAYAVLGANVPPVPSGSAA